VICELAKPAARRLCRDLTWISAAAPDNARIREKLWAQMQSCCESADGHQGLEIGVVDLIVPSLPTELPEQGRWRTLSERFSLWICRRLLFSILLVFLFGTVANQEQGPCISGTQDEFDPFHREVIPCMALTIFCQASGVLAADPTSRPGRPRAGRRQASIMRPSSSCVTTFSPLPTAIITATASGDEGNRRHLPASGTKASSSTTGRPSRFQTCRFDPNR